MKTETILDTLDPEVVERMTSRRGALRELTTMGAGVALASVPLMLAGFARNAFAQSASLPVVVQNVLNFALLLEHLEAEFYVRGVAASGLIPADDRDVFVTIRDHELAHVAFLQAALGSRAIPKPNFDYTARGMFADVFSNYQTFLALSQGFEDTGVRAYKGQAPSLQPFDAILTAALTIHSVEARHASMIRRLRGQPGWIEFDRTDVPALQPVYQGEANTVHLGIDVTTVTSVDAEAVTEAFDEPLGTREVLRIVAPFLAPR